jgi:hypothetical protein
MVRPILAALTLTLAAAAWPVTEGETLTGRKMTVPASFAGKPAVLVFSFSRQAGEKVRYWLDPLLKDGVNAWSVANLEAAPRLIRGLIRSGMKKDMLPDAQAHSVLLYKDDKEWRQALGIEKDETPVIVLLDTKGQVVWKHQGLFEQNTYRALLKRFSEYNGA